VSRVRATMAAMEREVLARLRPQLGDTEANLLASVIANSGRESPQGLG